MPATSLRRLPTLKLRRQALTMPNLTVTGGKLAGEKPPDPFAVVFPFGSRLEVAAYKYAKTQNPYWEGTGAAGSSGGQFGAPGSYGSTRVDLINWQMHVAWYIDGYYWHRYKTAQDQIDRLIVEQSGFKVVALEWNSTPEAMYAYLPKWYPEHIG